MVPSPWVWRHDGTLQCGLGTEESVEEAREELIAILGEENVGQGEKRQLSGPIITLCGAPTGQVNAVQVSPWGFWLLYHGIAGSLGFAPWIDESAVPQSQGRVQDEVPLGALVAAGLGTEDTPIRIVSAYGGGEGTHPSQIRQLLGRLCRCYHTGDPLTKDLRPDRVNIELNSRNRVVSIWFG